MNRSLIPLSDDCFHCRLKRFHGDLGRLPISKKDYVRTVYTTTDYVIAYYNKISRGELNKMVPVTDKKVLIVMSTMYFRKHSCLVLTMNEHIEHFVAHGLVSK